MRVLGIDPGLTRMGLGIVSTEGHRGLIFEHVEVLTTAPGQELSERIATLGASLAKVIDSNTIEEVAIERVFVGENLPSVMGVAQITGVVLYLAGMRNIPVTLYSPNQIKSRVTGYGAANKTQVTNMVTRILGLSSAPKPADAADALALAITHAWSMQRGQQTPGAKAGSGLTPAQLAWQTAEKSSKRKRF